MMETLQHPAKALLTHLGTADTPVILGTLKGSTAWLAQAILHAPTKEVVMTNMTFWRTSLLTLSKMISGLFSPTPTPRNCLASASAPREYCHNELAVPT
jgi:hypothetical protein